MRRLPRARSRAILAQSGLSAGVAAYLTASTVFAPRAPAAVAVIPALAGWDHLCQAFLRGVSSDPMAKRRSGLDPAVDEDGMTDDCAQNRDEALAAASNTVRELARKSQQDALALLQQQADLDQLLSWALGQDPAAVCSHVGHISGPGVPGVGLIFVYFAGAGPQCPTYFGRCERAQVACGGANPGHQMCTRPPRGSTTVGASMGECPGRREH